MARISTVPTRATDDAARDTGPLDGIPVLLLIRMAMQRHTAMFMSNMIGELTQTQFATMARLLETGPCSQNHLGRLVFLDASTINGVVGRLKRRGLVETRDDPNDIRRTILSLSRKGRRLIGPAIAVASHVNEETLQSLTSKDRDLLTGLLRKLGHPPTVVEAHDSEPAMSRARRPKAATASSDGARV